MSEHTLTVEKFVQAPPAQVYRAFTNGTALREWLCDVASIAARPAGRMYLYWNGDFYSSGEYLQLEPNSKVAFTWFGRGDPAATRVVISLAEKDGGTQLTLAHTVQDEKSIAGFQSEWGTSLNNLASVLETGKDLRIFDRPMLGISLGDYTPEQAQKLGVPETEGMRLDGVTEGLGAHAAGLQPDDVLVGLAGKPLTRDFGSFAAALQGKKGGDVVEVIYYRGPQKKTVQMKLSPRPVPEIPFDPRQAADQLRRQRQEGLELLKAAFANVSQEEALFHPAPEEWNALEVVAHLIHGERYTLQNITEVVTSFESLADDWGGNLLLQNRATVAAFPTAALLLEELEHLATELVALVENLPPEFVARKGSYFRLMQGLLAGGPGHTRGHLGQIEAAIAAARAH